MGIINRFPGGGGTAKIKIMACSSAISLPASATEGTVAVITTTPIANVYASASAPASPADNDLWLWLGAQSLAPIALGNSGITLHLRAAYQRVSGAWVSVRSFVFTSGAWQEAALYIYDHGYEVLTTLSQNNAGYQYTYCTYTKNAAEITVYHAAQSSRSLWTDDPIDLTDIATVELVITQTYASGFQRYFAVATTQAIDYTGYTAYDNFGGAATGTLTRAINVAAISGNHFVGVNLNSPSGYTERILSIRLMK